MGGYQKYYNQELDCLDEYDLSSHASLLLAEDEHHEVVGTLRILDRRYGKVELDKFIDLDSCLAENERLCVEATRFSIPKHPNSKTIKLLLWKALFLYCELNDINTIIMSVRPAAARSYRCLCFENAGPLGAYNHPSLGNLEHHTYKLNISERKYTLKESNWPLYHFFFDQDHPTINNRGYLQ